MKDKVDKLLKIVGLSDKGNNYPDELSGGEKQRVAIARALAFNPTILVADEPTGNLDTKTGTNVMNFLQDLHKKGKTIVMVTHDVELIDSYPDIVYWLRDGKIEKITKRSKAGKG